MAVWLFEDDEFQAWLETRGPYDAQFLLEHSEKCRCVSCGTDLGKAGYSHGPVCGYCLAYQFGVDSQERMLAETIAALTRVIASGDTDRNQRLFRQLLNDLRASLSSAA